MAMFHRRKTEGNYEKKRKNYPLIAAVVLFAAVFLGFLVLSAVRGSVSAKDLVASAGAGKTVTEDEGAYALTFAPLLDENGCSVYDNAGHTLYVDEDGNVFYEDEDGYRRLVGWEGQPILDHEGTHMCVDLCGNYFVPATSGLWELRSEYGTPVCDEEGKGLHVDTFGNFFVIDASGGRVLVTASGKSVTDTNGNRVFLTGSAQDAIYGTSRRLREEKTLAADYVHETIQGASEGAGEAFRGHIQSAALRTRETLRVAADKTGDFVRESADDFRESSLEAVEGVKNAASDVEESAKGAANSWYSFLRNDWEKLKKDLVTPADEFSNGNIPNPEENEINELFP